jgi:hypothetical protein
LLILFWKGVGWRRVLSLPLTSLNLVAPGGPSAEQLIDLGALATLRSLTCEDHEAGLPRAEEGAPLFPALTEIDCLTLHTDADAVLDMCAHSPLRSIRIEARDFPWSLPPLARFPALEVLDLRDCKTVRTAERLQNVVDALPTTLRELRLDVLGVKAGQAGGVSPEQRALCLARLVNLQLFCGHRSTCPRALADHTALGCPTPPPPPPPQEKAELGRTRDEVEEEEDEDEGEGEMQEEEDADAL